MPTPSNLNTSPPTARESGDAIHRRESWWQIWLPFGLGVLLIIGLAVIAGLSTDPQALLRVGALSDILFTIMVLCPIFICLLPIFVILVAMIYGMHRLHNSVGTPLERLERATETMSQRIDETTERVNRRVADWSARFEELTPILDTFDDSSEETTHAEPPETPKPEDN